ncbi:MAG TPA: RNA polymerase sigma factor [Thermoanaerobaculia bacterium]|nr:RNA polymerase sigma factor [Thermoanaerobaculia bacterium]
MTRRDDEGEDEGEEKPPPVKPEGLTRESFEILLAQLDPDRDRAGERYETIRRKLIRLFEWRGCAAPEDLTDETFNRVARRIAQGVELHSADPYGYFCGVAHLVFKEVLRRASREHRALDTNGELLLPAPMPVIPEESGDPRLEYLRQCLAALPPDQRDLVLRYFQGESNIRHRKTLSEELGIPMNALRIRVHRVRRKLEACLADCLCRHPERPS